MQNPVLTAVSHFCRILLLGGGSPGGEGGAAPSSDNRGTSFIRNRPNLGLYSRPTPRVLGGSYWDVRFFMGKVPLYKSTPPRS